MAPPLVDAPAKVEAAPADSSYTEERRERLAFDEGFVRKTHVILSGTVPGIDFGNILTSESPSSGGVETAEADPCGEYGHMKGYIWGLGDRPSTVRGKLSLVREQEDDPQEGDMVYAQLVDGADQDKVSKSGTLSFLERHSLASQDGPYADRDGAVAALADVIFHGVKRDALLELIERVIDIRPFTGPDAEIGPRFQRMHQFEFGFISRNDFMPPDELPTAGNILTQTRSMQFKKSMKFQLVHPMEQYILAAALLRTRGYAAYPAFGVLTGPDELTDTRPIIAVIDMKNQAPLTTFDLTRSHPPMDAITIMSDTAVMGALHAMRAETRCKHLAAEMVKWGEHGALLPMDDVSTQLHRIARSLFESVKRWDQNLLISKAMTFLYNISGNALMESMQNVYESQSQPGDAEAVGSAVDKILKSGIEPADLVDNGDMAIQNAAKMLCSMVRSRDEIIDTVQTLLGAYISKAQK